MSKNMYIFDSLTQKNVLLKLEKEHKISLYVCGITPYSDAHIGHGRCYIVYDVLLRLLRFNNILILYCRNVTDIDDKLIDKAKKTYYDATKYKIIAEKYFSEFSSLLLDFGCVRPDYEPRATDYIKQMIEDITLLLENNNAYKTNDGIYFDTTLSHSYGLLGNRLLNDHQEGIRIEVNTEKKSKNDFALWKFYSDEPFWESPWGRGRPGWHTECCTMIKKTFSLPITIHGGGQDLIFPHHENERAIAEAHNEKILSSLWMHVSFLLIKKNKMSKSSNNIISLKEIKEKAHPMAFRLYCLMNHYRTPLNFSYQDLISFEKMYMNIISLALYKTFDEKDSLNNNEKKSNEEIYNEIESSLYNDINTAFSIGLIFKHEKKIIKNKELHKKIKTLITSVLGISIDEEWYENKKKYLNNDAINNDPEIKELLQKREKAREEKNFKEADRIRNILKEKNIIINDKKIE